jgi:hypothetical protein
VPVPKWRFAFDSIPRAQLPQFVAAPRWTIVVGAVQPSSPDDVLIVPVAGGPIVAMEPDPTPRALSPVRAQLQCELGAEIGVSGPSTADTKTPEAALALLTQPGYSSIPRTGFVAGNTGRDSVVYLYRAAGRVRAVVAAHRTAAAKWTVAEYWTCDPAEFAARDRPPGLRVWTRSGGGGLAPTSEIRDLAGSASCGLASVRFLERQPEGGPRLTFVRDPNHLLRARQVAGIGFAADAPLPADAYDAGYRLGQSRLFEVPDARALYVVAPTHVEVWPRISGFAGCAA